jgi:hypothetical protein
MGSLPHGQLHATIDPNALDPLACCDRCGFVYNHSKLQFQPILAGNHFVNSGLLVCEVCLDVRNEQVRALRIPADPVPIANPRPAPWQLQEAEN